VNRICGFASLHRTRFSQAAILYGATTKIKIGGGFYIVPMWHPLRPAEDYAVADILTGGRVIFGVGRLSHP
jgi:alkanesulfonate monooxygenase SsuD/methylene tetrahydromethanopterin reductase-like flavin-dependent oxidoreductase (luciferase family)